MYTKQAATALASLAMAKQALAFNAHRHMHMDARAVDYAHTATDVVVEWVTVTVTAGQEGPSPDPVPVTEEVQQEDNVEEEPAEEQQPAPVPEAAAPAPSESPKEESSEGNNTPEVQKGNQVDDSEKEEEEESSSDDSSDSSSNSGNGSTGVKGAKRGLAYNKAELCDAFGSTEKLGWAWNWDQTANGLSGDLEFVPTLWAPNDDHLPRWEENVKEAVKNGATHIMSFNECDIGTQCNMEAGLAADAHVKYMNPYGSDTVKIGAPSVSNSNIDGEGLDWLSDWVEACKSKGCQFDFCNVHWYSPLDAADTLYDHIKQASKICDGKPVWLTEFAPLGADGNEASPAEAADWLADVLGELDSLDELERYSYFMVEDGKLVSGNGLSDSGKAYLA